MLAIVLQGLKNDSSNTLYNDQESRLLKWREAV